jgi:hypothetical protein
MLRLMKFVPAYRITGKRLAAWLLIGSLLSCTKTTVPSQPVIEYEIRTTSTFAPAIPGSTAATFIVSYTNETGQIQQEQLNLTGSVWKKKVVVTTPQRPISVVCMASGYITSAGQVESKVHVDGVLRGNVTAQATGELMPGLWMFPGLYISGILIN